MAKKKKGTHIKRNAPSDRVRRAEEDRVLRAAGFKYGIEKKNEVIVNFYEVALDANSEQGGLLRVAAVEVPQPIEQEMFDLCVRLVWVTEHDPNCLGIAAPQVGVPVRIFTMQDNDGSVWCVVNPTVEYDAGSLRYSEYEGCFSLPDQKVLIERWSGVTVRGLAPSGDPFERKFSGRAARVVQHEMDHLDGVMIDAHGELEPVEGDVISTGAKIDASTTDELVAALEAET